MMKTAVEPVKLAVGKIQLFTTTVLLTPKRKKSSTVLGFALGLGLPLLAMYFLPGIVVGIWRMVTCNC